MKKQKKKPGPKARPLDQKYSASIEVAMLPRERELLEQEARKLGLTTSQLLMRPWREQWSRDGKEK
jgi:hypothetical protein